MNSLHSRDSHAGEPDMTFKALDDKTTSYYIAWGMPLERIQW
jgi:hypothetical protein